ncbi:hypothetical protein [Brevifollis gellanilyticus]|uniref:Uncharacterized protein n=1 Tax=Brevifollis gellanilyticus TaxID=748831 RepID=A0A512M200_9BACT|nr:hypothetical protein [Brevifollis gellanilyticus]GEP40770.1 hypothetical protein BGE01nite_00610 [Brevifollis gellanilyticus]
MSLPTRLWSRRWLRVLTWILITLVTLWVLLAVVLKWTGQRRWQRLTQELESKNETLDFVKLQPPPVPNDQNLAAIDALNGIRLGPGDTPEAKAAETKRKRIEDAESLFRSAASQATQTIVPRGDPLGKALPPSIPDIIGQLEVSKLQLTKESDAAALRQAIEKHAPFITEITQAALTRTEVDYLPRWDQTPLPQPLFALPIPYCTTTNALGRLLQLHGIACAESGDPEAATADVVTLLRLAEGHLKEPLLICHLVGMVLHQNAASLTWLLLQKRALSDTQLRSLQTAFSRLEMPASLLQAMRGEMAFGADMAAHLEKNAAAYAMLKNMTENFRQSPFEAVFVKMIPSGFFTHAKVSLVQAEWDHLVHPLQHQSFKTALQSPGQAEDWLKSISLLKRPDLLLAKMALPAVSQVKLSSALAENTRRQALLACALERHFIQHGIYPASLDALEPVTLAGATKTAFDESPMHYLASTDGRYRLWHNGPDGKDDGGAVAKEKKSPGSSPSPRDPQYLGDWTWRYEPLKE